MDDQAGHGKNDHELHDPADTDVAVLVLMARVVVMNRVHQ
jgi:hypothetical protein